ncbi:MAG TPA: hypothetical protein VEF76_05175 [Patescibacteria group bacterium]|nr:hypothetical protein [Patescibacteria group bacterium]
MTQTPKKQHKPAASGPGPLRFDFNKAAKKALRDHPELRGRQMFIHAGRDDAAPFVEKLLLKGVDDEDIEDLEKTIRTAKRLKTSFHQAVTRERGKPVGVLVFHPDRHPVFGVTSGAADDAGTFDHELGHALTPDLQGTPAENMADAFAALRHFERFEDATAHIRYAAWKRAAISMLTGTTSHLTTFTLDKIVIDAQAANFSTLSPADAKAIAADYARKCTPSPKRLAKLAHDFAPLKKMPVTDAMEKLAAITLKAKTSSDTFYLGARVLTQALAEPDLRLDGRRVKLAGPERDAIRGRLTARIEKLPKKHPLRKLGPNWRSYD